MNNSNSKIDKKPATVAVVGLILLAAIGVGGWLVFRDGNEASSESCIQLPEVTSERIRTAALELGADFEKIEIDSKLKSNFQQQATTTFAALESKEVSLLLLLRALECYVRIADTPDKKELASEVSKELVPIIRSLWSEEYELRGDGLELSIKEKDLIRASELGDALFAELAKYGIQ